MVEKKASDRLLDAAIDKLLDVVVTAIIGGVSVAFGVLSGSFARVLDFATNHPFEAFLWSAAFLCAGIVAGLLIRHAISVAHLKRSISEKDAEMEALRAEKDAEMEALRAEKDAEIDRLRRNIVGLEDVDRIMRHLPPNFHDILSAIYANGGSMVLPLSGELRGLVNRHVLNGDEGPTGVYTWSLPPGVMDYFDKRVGRPIVAGRPSTTTGA